ncbi:MAG: hypothetical protein ABIW16_06140 [Sphingomicrobium sp.]
MISTIAIACHAAPPIDANRVLSVEEVIANIDQFNGKRVRIGGYLGRCEGYDCMLFSNARDQQAFAAFIADPRAWGDKQLPDELGIGWNLAFDQAARPFNNRYVMITGKVSNHCRRHAKAVCTDRAEDISPIEIAPWRPASQRSSGAIRS